MFYFVKIKTDESLSYYHKVTLLCDGVPKHNVFCAGCDTGRPAFVGKKLGDYPLCIGS
jgi:hypothetical protein